ncbi:MAG TPA: DUF2795 domain-containing protein [Gaiellaceae bacterium]|nr:DUF2795 domain-containing protein [Gaiellaceae bacterium]
MNRAYVESLLSGIALLASKRELVAYARRQEDGAAAAERLRALPEREYRALQDVGEELEPRQPEARQAPTTLPREESDLPPGGAAYLGEAVEPANVAALKRG